MRTFTLVLLLAASAGAPAMAGEVYKWVDEDGQVHFGDRPPAGRAQTLDLPEADAADPPPGLRERRDKRRRLLEAYQEERLQRKEARAEARAEAQERRRRCLLARDNLRSYTEAGAIYDLDDAGERVYMEEVEREAYIDKWRATVARWCD